MAFGIRSFFPGANFGLRQFVSRLNLTPPVSVRTIAANEAIATRFRDLGGFKGPLGVATGPVTAAGNSFLQTFRGGTLRFTADGTTLQDEAIELKIEFQGIRCFGQPGLLKSDNVYAVINVFGPEQALIKTRKEPNDGTDDSWHLETGNTQQVGAEALQLVAGPTPPQPITIAVTVWRCNRFGQCKSTGVKSAIETAATGAGAAAGFTAGTPLGPPGQAAGTVLGAYVGKLLGGFLAGTILGLDDTLIGGMPIQFNSVEELKSPPLPPFNSLKSPPNNDGFNAIRTTFRAALSLMVMPPTWCILTSVPMSSGRDRHSPGAQMQQLGVVRGTATVSI